MKRNLGIAVVLVIAFAFSSIGCRTGQGPFSSFGSGFGRGCSDGSCGCADGSCEVNSSYAPQQTLYSGSAGSGSTYVPNGSGTTYSTGGSGTVSPPPLQNFGGGSGTRSFGGSGSR